MIEMIEFVPLPEIGLGPLTLNAHGVFIALGIIVAYFIFNKRTTDKQLLSIRDNLLTILIISGIIGARLLYVLTNLDYYATNPVSVIKIWEGGISFLGGLLFATAISYVYLQKKKLNPLKVADSLIIPVIVGHFVGRIGDLLTWDHPGTYLELAWAFVVNGTPQHPAIAYEMLGLLVILGILLFVSKRKIFEGKQFLIYLGLYGALRLFVDNFREEPIYFGFRLAQIIGLALLAGSIFYAVYNYLKTLYLANRRKIT